MASPYDAYGDHQFWRRAVSRIEPHLFDPVIEPRFRIDGAARVATAGSCFAQNISRKLTEIGFTYFVTEDGADLAPDERARRQFGTFSARYGNIYTTAQLAQLLDESVGRRMPADVAWRRSDGRYVDPLRPSVEPAGYETPAEVSLARQAHLAAVRAMVEGCDVFIFTLGLTEAWRSVVDGTVFPLAPGVAAGHFDPATVEPVNFSVAEVEADLVRALDHIRAVNPSVKVILTVSPVPLIATFENRHVLCSTTYSKSVLRVAAESVLAGRPWVDYFPSYEIFTGSNAGGRYYEDDYREVNSLGVAHAMRCFLSNYTDRPKRTEVAAPGRGASAGARSGSGIVCDEEMIDAVRG